MSQEYFDVLDEFGNKTGKTKLRSDVHKDGDWHRSVHIWILNKDRDVLLQRRCATKDSHPNMLDISSAGHLTAGDDTLSGALRELKEELNIDVTPNELQYIKTFKKHSKPNNSFVNNEFADMYIYITDKTIDEMTYQEEEISEILFVPYNTFKQMVNDKHPELLMHTEEFAVLFEMFDREE